MQSSTIYAAGSVAVAAVLLIGPYSTVHALGNLYEISRGHGQQDRFNTKEAARQRVEMCGRVSSLYHTLVVVPSPLAHQPDSAGPGPSTADSRPESGPFFVDEYKSAVEEIRSRIGQEEILFGLKFTLIGGIMAVLFSIFRGDEKDYFEKLVQKRRAAAFFSAALLTSVIVDTRLRFNAKVIESLGNWVWCLERRYVAAGRPTTLVPWEGFLHFQLDGGANPLLRYSSHLLTALLFGVTLYLFVVMPRTVNRSTRTMLGHGGVKVIHLAA